MSAPANIITPEIDAALVSNKRGADHRWFAILDAVRGTAAFYVVCSHACILLLIGFKQARSLGMPLAVKLTAACSYLFAFGHQAVILFFVLSGFCIHFRQAQRLHDGKQGAAVFQAIPYFGRRLRRIVPPYYFAILFTAAVDWLIRCLGSSFVAPKTGNFLADNILAQHNGVQTLLGNLVFLQWLKCPTWGNDTPLWSLSYEFGFYLLYPLFWHLRLRAGSRGSVVVIAGISLAAMLCGAHWPQSPVWVLPIFAYWLIWVLGALASEIYVSQKTWTGNWFHPAFLLLLGAIWLGTIRLLPTVVSDTLGGAICTLALLAILECYGRRPIEAGAGPFLAVMGPVGMFSYSLYLTHVPVLALICCLWMRSHDAMPTNPILFLTGVGAALGVGWLAFRLVERRFTNHP